ncbi:MAG: hypothetical protein JWQ11_1464, partial [Rhizobacter sp.]|nr:hypothetical protein [Rhizobacter sp.]
MPVAAMCSQLVAEHLALRSADKAKLFGALNQAQMMLEVASRFVARVR